MKKNDFGLNTIIHRIKIMAIILILVAIQVVLNLNLLKEKLEKHLKRNGIIQKLQKKCVRG